MMRRIPFILTVISLPLVAQAQTASVRPGHVRTITDPATMTDTATYADYFGAIMWRNTPTATAGTARTTTLPTCNAAAHGMQIVVLDNIGNARTWPIVVNGPGGTNVGGNPAGIRLDQGRASVTFMCDGINNWAATSLTIPDFNVIAGGASLDAAVNGGVVYYNSTGATAVSLPNYAPGSYSVAVINYGTGIVTITPGAGRTIGFQSSIALNQNQSAVIYANDPDNAVILTGVGGGNGGGGEIAIPNLAGDVTGAITSNQIHSLYGRPISSTPPNVNDVLVWNGSAWVPTPSGGGTPPVSPTITSVSPTSGVPGTTVTITGANFGVIQGTSTVTFGGTPSTLFPSWDETEILALVPSIAPGTANVVVTVAGVSSAASPFTVTSALTPTINSLTPTSGAVGSSVVIAGANFGSPQGSSTVRFGLTNAAVTAWANDSVTATVPTIPEGVASVTVTVNSVVSAGTPFTVAAPPPTISSLTPNSCWIGCSITIVGANYGDTQGSSSVTFGGTAATPTSWSATSITAPVPAGVANGATTVVVTVGSAASSGAAFTVTAAPNLGFDTTGGSYSGTVFSNNNTTATFNVGSPASGWGTAKATIGYVEGANELRIFNMVPTIPNTSGAVFHTGLAQTGNSLTNWIGCCQGSGMNGTVTGPGSSLGIQVPYTNTAAVNSYALLAAASGANGQDANAANCNKTGGTPGGRFQNGSTIWLAVNFNNGQYSCSSDCVTWHAPTIWVPTGGGAVTLQAGSTFYPAISASPASAAPAAAISATMHLDPDLSTCTAPTGVGSPAGVWRSWSGGHQIGP